MSQEGKTNQQMYILLYLYIVIFIIRTDNKL